ncbi:hypothetical protein PV726_47245 [Streptomyces europaeiscabiei]|uniref:hypothetical protein n=1 Tax=Streptomyces europaeiscabiei TaxID=146819 RepID=UPI0029B4E68B|nr:hypothetical protein [Streptomyces europaeiscabiei]MDX3697650.1 hypothetical protein [Streptomyces europaeiscabiei]
MARRSSKSTAPTKPLLKAPVRIGRLDAAAIVGELRQLHEDAEDPDVDRMPADEELYGALLYLEAHADALKTTDARREAAIKRVRLWEYLREQTDSHQAKAIEEARAVNTEWRELAPALAVHSPSAAYNKATRLRAAALSNVSPDDQPVRRTPEAVLEAERQAALRAAAERRAQEEAARLHGLLAPIAKRLIGHRDGLDDDDDVTFWLDQIDALLPSCHTPTQLLSLETYVKAVVRELRRVERTTARSAASTTDAQLAYAAAVELVL